MYIEPLFPIAEVVVIGCILLVAAGYKIVQYRRYRKLYPYAVLRLLRSSDRVIYKTWSSFTTPRVKRRKTIYIGTSNGVPVYMKEADL